MGGILPAIAELANATAARKPEEETEGVEIFYRRELNRRERGYGDFSSASF
jgi:hypothetical protein